MFGQLPLPGGHQNRTPLVLKRSNAFVLKPVNLKPSRIPLLPNEDFDQNRNICQNLSNHLSTCPPPSTKYIQHSPILSTCHINGQFRCWEPSKLCALQLLRLLRLRGSPPKKKIGWKCRCFLSLVFVGWVSLSIIDCFS